jgi:hypothetical protein
MTIQRMKKPGGGSNPETTVMELGGVEIPDVSDQLQRLSAAAEAAGDQKAEKKQRDKRREELYRCCQIRVMD